MSEFWVGFYEVFNSRRTGAMAAMALVLVTVLAGVRLAFWLEHKR